ncbi:MAG: hypothetical protein WD851_09355 [Pirellulales bacterium]
MPSPAESNGHHGRDTSGRFAPGNKAGRGNPLARKVQQLRAALVQAVTEADVKNIIAALVKAAKAGDVVAAREILDRTIGKPAQTHLLQRVEDLETLLMERSHDEP